MTQVAELIADLLRRRRIAVAGVSRGTASGANLVFRKLQNSAYAVFPVKPIGFGHRGMRWWLGWRGRIGA
jgi:predicted CoA-binding protein